MRELVHDAGRLGWPEAFVGYEACKWWLEEDNRTAVRAGARVRKRHPVLQTAVARVAVPMSSAP